MPPSTRVAATATARWEALGTSVVVRVRDPRRIAVARAAVERELDVIDLACSRFRDDSELARVNARAGRVTVVSPLFAQALEVALRAAELSDGDVDPTLGRALADAGYDRDWKLMLVDDGRWPPSAAAPAAPAAPGHRRTLPQPAPPAALPTVLARARAHGGWQAVRLDRATFGVRVPAGVQLDLGASAKAWAADRAARAAAAGAGCGALVSVGGDLAVAGDAPPGGWLVHVTDDHRAPSSAPGQTVAIGDGGLATSSTTVRRWRRAGRTLHHIVDPHTGMPAHERWRTVSVAAASCVDANTAATAAIVRGAQAPAWLARVGLPARLVDRRGEVTYVGGWPREGETATGRAA